ncbi:MAG: autotransporter outer membrane beta-barrel domain-containing protein [Methylocella sp.]
MGGAIPKFTAIALFSSATVLFVLGHPAEVRAQAVFCPTVASIPGFGTASGITFQNGLCTNGATGAFSGAALASQALSELSETTTQETTKNAVKAVSERREQEKERCAEGFSRVDGTCQRIPPQVSEAAPVAPAGPPEEHALKKTKKPKTAAVASKEAVAPAPKMVHLAPPSLSVLAPVPVEPAVRFATWTQVYGDYERRSAEGSTSVPTSGFGGAPRAPVELDLSLQSRTGTVGFLAGGDFTSRGTLFSNDGLIFGAMAGYVSSNLTLNQSSISGQPGTLGNGSAHVNDNLAGPMAGLYATYFNGGFSTDLTLKVDALRLNETFNELLSFSNPDPTVLPGNFLFSGGGSVNLLNATVAANLNYRFDLYPNFWLEPTVGAQYTNSSYGSGAADLGLADGNLVMVQGGARLGNSTFINDRVLMTTTLTGLAYDDVLVAGGFIPVSLFNGVNLLAQADQGFVRGRGILALNLDYGNGISSFVQGEVRGGAHLFGAGGRAGVRVVW